MNGQRQWKTLQKTGCEIPDFLLVFHGFVTKQKSFKKNRKKRLIGGGFGLSYRPAQFRTCLWSCVSWWASGQEAGQPPGFVRLLDESDNQSAAGGETGVPRSPRGTRLKATTERAFSSLFALQRQRTRRGLSILPTVRRGSPFQSKAVHAVDPTPLAFPTRRSGKSSPDVL